MVVVCVVLVGELRPTLVDTPLRSRLLQARSARCAAPAVRNERQRACQVSEADLAAGGVVGASGALEVAAALGVAGEATVVEAAGAGVAAAIKATSNGAAAAAIITEVGEAVAVLASKVAAKAVAIRCALHSNSSRGQCARCSTRQL